MSIKNFKLYQNASLKLLKGALLTSISAFALTGCSNDSILADTLLDGAVVITFDDGTKEVAEIFEACEKTEFSHYRSVINDTYFTVPDCDNAGSWSTNVYFKKDIVKEESITTFLTSDDVVKAASGNLENEDIANIINRALGFTEEKENTANKSLTLEK